MQQRTFSFQQRKDDGIRSWRQSMLRLELPQELSRVHHTFHVSNLKKCYADEPLVMPLEGIHVDNKLQFVEEPVEIMEREIKRLKRSRIPLVKALNGVIHYLLGHLLSFRELPAKVNKARGAMIHWESIIEESTLKFCRSLWGQVLFIVEQFEAMGLLTMSSTTSVVTYTSVYTDSEPGRAFWGADDDEVSEGGIPRVIVLGYDGLLIQPVAPPSLDYIPGPKDPQTPPVPQDEDEREPMFVQAQDPDYMPEPIYPEYIPLEDEHEFLAEEQPILPVDSPTAESPGYVTESDPEEDPKEYEDDEIEDGPVDYPMDGGDNGDDDDDDSSRDDANDEDEDDKDEEEEEDEHLVMAYPAIVVPVDEPVFPPEGTEPVIPPPSTDNITIREGLPSTLSSPPPVPSPLLPSSGCPTQIQTLRIASTQALIDVVTVALPLHPLPPSLYIPPPVNHWDDLPESELPLRKRLCLSTLGSRYKIRESSTARPTGGRGDTWIDLAEAVPEVAPMTVGEAHQTQLQLQSTLIQTQHQVHETRFQMQQAEIAALCETDRRRQEQMVETLRVMRDMRREMGDMQAEVIVQACSYSGVSQASIALELCLKPLLGGNGQIRTLGPEAYAMTWEGLKKKMTDKYCLLELTLICTKFCANETKKINKYIRGLPDNIYGNLKSSKPKTLDETIKLANDLMDQKLRTYAEKYDNKRKADDSSRNNHGHQQ
ncbi:hypothetical protein Tco_1386124 [Tanacetum coccineum]